MLCPCHVVAGCVLSDEERKESALIQSYLVELVRVKLKSFPHPEVVKAFSLIWFCASTHPSRYIHWILVENGPPFKPRLIKQRLVAKHSLFEVNRLLQNPNMMRFFLLSLALSSVTAFAPSMQKTVRTTQGVANSPLFRNNNKVSSTQRSAVLEQTELPEKLYFKQAKEMPKVLGGLKIGLRELVVVTGASSGLGLNCAATLAKTGKYFVVMAVRDIEKAKRGKPHSLLILSS